MGFSLSGAFQGALGGAGAGSMFGPIGAGVGAGIGGLFGGAFQPEEPSYEMSPEQRALLQNQLDIASGKIESPETQALRAQSNKNMAQMTGAMQSERGATKGARSAYLMNLGGQNQAQTNEAAALANAQARQQATVNAANMLSGQQALNIKSAENQANRKSNFLGAMTQLGAWGAGQYMNSGKSTQDAGAGVDSLSDMIGDEPQTPSAYSPGRYNMGTSKYLTSFSK